jgi:alkanesulfonate monooxygenase SsuD/methylene tetrahydromethanopterin reductase-like flavin-dependent oxidoreductase (luciferase family)
MITDMCWEHAMKLGVALPLSDISGDPATVRLFAQAAEAAGYDHLGAPDHVLGSMPRVGPAGARAIPRPISSMILLSCLGF